MGRHAGGGSGQISTDVRVGSLLRDTELEGSVAVLWTLRHVSEGLGGAGRVREWKSPG